MHLIGRGYGLLKYGHVRFHYFLLQFVYACFRTLFIKSKLTIPPGIAFTLHYLYHLHHELVQINENVILAEVLGY